MNGTDILASRYAAAFVNVYASKITEKDFFKIKNARDFFSENPDVLTMLEFPFVKQEKQIFIEKLLQKLSLMEEFLRLIELLINSNRISLFNKILEFITWEYQLAKNVVFFRVYTSHGIDESRIEIIKEFLSMKTNKDILYKYEVDGALIAGIKAVSSNYLWEHSVQSQLQKAKRAFGVTNEN